MKAKKQWMALLAIGVLSAGILAGCGNSDTDSTADAGSSAVESTQNEENTDTIGEVKTNDGSTLTLDLYKSNKKITNYMNMDGVTLKATDKTEAIDIEEDAVIERVENDEMLPIDAGDISAGDMVAVSETKDGTQRIVVFIYKDNGNGNQVATNSNTDNDDQDASDTDDSDDKDADQNGSDDNTGGGTDGNTNQGHANQGSNGQDANSGHQGGNNNGTTVTPGGGDAGNNTSGDGSGSGGTTVNPGGGSQGGASGSENTGTVVNGNTATVE